MNCGYEDIRSRIAEKPRWFDENAVPRYCEFTPEAGDDFEWVRDHSLEVTFEDAA